MGLDVSALGNACAKASFVINAIGPFARCGAAIARTAVECGRPYLDCANEQLHYRNPAARKRLLEVPTIDDLTIPGRFTLQEFHTWLCMIAQAPSITGAISAQAPK